jgi:Flp pilus assembly pilin Flp
MATLFKRIAQAGSGVTLPEYSVIAVGITVAIVMVITLRLIG